MLYFQTAGASLGQSEQRMGMFVHGDRAAGCLVRVRERVYLAGQRVLL